MATRGRKPKPVALKVLEGNRSKRPIEGETITPPDDDFECPEWLLDEAKAEWNRLAPALKAQGVLTALDMAAFAGYCQAYARWKEAEILISKCGSTFETPSGYIQQTPYIAIANHAVKEMQSFCSEFGLTPASRARMITNANNGSAEEDPMEKLLKQSRVM